jgi:hypothetical protein
MRSILVCLLIAAVATHAGKPMHEQLRAKYDFHLNQLHQAELDHRNTAQAKGVAQVPELHALVEEKERTAAASWKEYTDHVRQQPGATEHQVEHDGENFIIKPLAKKMKPMDNDNGDHWGQLGHEYAELLVNNTRTINAAVRLYNIANDTVCDAYINALRAGRFDGNAAINAMLDVILSPNAKGTIQPNFHVRPRIPIVSYFMLACAGNSSRVVKETFTSVIAWNNRVMYNMYFTLRAANGVDRLLTHVGEARVNPDGRVCGFKANFQRLGFGLGDAVLPAIANFDSVKISQNNTIVARCQTIQATCPVNDPTLKQFDDVDACYNYFKTLPNGGWERSDQRDRGCAFSLHLQFAPIRPDIHCVHVGPTGGDFCIPHAYNDIVLSDDQLWTDCQ